ncbi:glutamine--fructose-6-phosphate transaminase (isomerizing) [Bacillus bombysepticus]|uniref:glutamine--fructose-6-phosphate transaminase (isomerizing) n=1 Tax=Bacillus bombysepticus TaxID=658666 RepID=UPI003016C7B3
MCGIVGYVGQNQAMPFLVHGLQKLEYRGYDSAGIALLNQGRVSLYKEEGKLENLTLVLPQTHEARIGIGHTRWATHGKPAKRNAHPHMSESGRFFLVHNGVIENEQELRELLKDVELQSETDTELIVQLVEKHFNEGMSVEAAFCQTVEMLHGSYALAMFDVENEEKIYVAKNKSPLLVGLGEGFSVVVSDAMASIHMTKNYLEIQDEEIVILEKDRYQISNSQGDLVERTPFEAQLDTSEIEKGIYEDYMLKEIDEQAIVVRKIVDEYRDENAIRMEAVTVEELRNADRLYIIACGTSYHAGLLGKEYFEKIANKPTEVHIASEFVYNMPLLSENPVFIFISQSGETADSRAVLKKVDEMGYPSVTITNVKGSTLSREATHTLLLHAGPEIAVASTKAYTAQLSVLLVTAHAVANNDGKEFFTELSKVANAIQTLCDQKEELHQIAKEYLADARNAFFIGRSFDYHVSLEAALKLKEISYVQAEGFAGGELKHGTIALIEEGTPVFVLATQEAVNLSIRGNEKEVAARGANTCIMSTPATAHEGDRFVIPQVGEFYQPIVAVVPLQLIAYYATKERGYDVDKPRNLAKSVTVE